MFLRWLSIKLCMKDIRLENFVLQTKCSWCRNLGHEMGFVQSLWYFIYNISERRLRVCKSKLFSLLQQIRKLELAFIHSYLSHHDFWWSHFMETDRQLGPSTHTQNSKTSISNSTCTIECLSELSQNKMVQKWLLAGFWKRYLPSRKLVEIPEDTIFHVQKTQNSTLIITDSFTRTLKDSQAAGIIDRAARTRRRRTRHLDSNHTEESQANETSKQRYHQVQLSRNECLGLDWPLATRM